MKTLPLKRALMAGAALSLMILPVGAMAPAFAQEEEVVEEWSDDEIAVAAEADDSAVAVEAEDAPVEAESEEAPAEAESDETGGGVTGGGVTGEEPPANEGAVPLSDEDGGSRAKSGPPT